MLPESMSDPAAYRRQMRFLAVGLTALWAATAVAVASAYRPGGPVDIVVGLVCFGPVLVADAGIVWPPVAGQQRHRVALVWLWIAALLLAIPVLYGVASTLAAGGPQNLVPSAEAAYAGVLALLVMCVFSVTGLVHGQHGQVAFERRATLLSIGLAVGLTALIAAAFGLVALINDEALREVEVLQSRYGPTDPDLVPPACDEPVALGRHAQVTILARSILDVEDRGVAVLAGRRSGIDETWSGSWSGPDGTGRAAYLRLGEQAWLNDATDDQAAPGSTWQAVRPDPFLLSGRDRLTMDGPPHAWVDVPRGAIVAEDLGLEVVDGAKARHCRTFMDGPTALSTFLPLRWLLHDGQEQAEADIRRWRGEMDWWVFADGELGRARVEVSGSRADTDWDATGVRAVLQAELEAVDRDLAVDLSSSAIAPAPPSAVIEAPSPAPEVSSGTPAAALESAAP
jgi:hypothetical protein